LKELRISDSLAFSAVRDLDVSIPVSNSSVYKEFDGSQIVRNGEALGEHLLCYSPMIQPKDTTMEFKIFLKSFLKEKVDSVTILWVFFLLISVPLFYESTHESKGIFLGLSLLMIFLIFLALALAIFSRNRPVVILGPEYIQFADPIHDFLLFPKWVKVKWTEVTRIQTYEINDSKFMFMPKWYVLDGIFSYKSLEGFGLATKVYVKTYEDKEKSLVVSFSNEMYSEYLNFIINKVSDSKMDAKTIELKDPKILLEEMLKRKSGFM
jgi:hypothetical protein